MLKKETEREKAATLSKDEGDYPRKRRAVFEEACPWLKFLTYWRGYGYGSVNEIYWGATGKDLWLWSYLLGCCQNSLDSWLLECWQCWLKRYPLECQHWRVCAMRFYVCHWPRRNHWPPSQKTRNTPKSRHEAPFSYSLPPMPSRYPDHRKEKEMSYQATKRHRKNINTYY